MFICDYCLEKEYVNEKSFERRHNYCEICTLVRQGTDIPYAYIPYQSITLTTTVDKSKWPDGPWENEPNYLQWVDEDTGYKCRIWRHPTLGHFCGYVFIPHNNKLYDKTRCEDFLNVEVYGGVTFCEKLNTGDKLIGFDCAHAFDYMPGNQFNSPDEKPSDYKDINFVKAECCRLAKSLKKFEELEN